MTDTSFKGWLHRICCTRCCYHKFKMNMDDIRHRENKLKLQEGNTVKYEFASTMRVVGEGLSMSYKCDHVIVINSMLRAIKLTLQYDCISRVLFKNGLPINPQAAAILCCPHDDFRSNEEHDWLYTEVYLDKDIVFTIPHDTKKFPRALLNIFENPFRHDKTNHEAYYYPRLNVTCVRNGLHSVAAGILHRKGKLYARIVDDEELLRRYYCDAINMYEKETDEIVRTLGDYRMGLIFELTRKLYKIL